MCQQCLYFFSSKHKIYLQQITPDSLIISKPTPHEPTLTWTRICGSGITVSGWFFIFTGKGFLVIHVSPRSVKISPPECWSKIDRFFHTVNIYTSNTGMRSTMVFRQTGQCLHFSEQELHAEIKFTWEIIAHKWISSTHLYIRYFKNLWHKCTRKTTYLHNIRCRQGIRTTLMSRSKQTRHNTFSCRSMTKTAMRTYRLEIAAIISLENPD